MEGGLPLPSLKKHSLFSPFPLDNVQDYYHPLLSLFFPHPLWFLSVSWLLWSLHVIYSHLKTWNKDLQIREKVWCLFLWVWMASLTITVSSFIHLAVNFMFPFPLQLTRTPLCKYTIIFLIYSLVVGYLGCFHPPPQCERSGNKHDSSSISM